MEVESTAQLLDQLDHTVHRVVDGWETLLAEERLSGLGEDGSGQVMQNSLILSKSRKGTTAAEEGDPLTGGISCLDMARLLNDKLSTTIGSL